MAHLKEFVIKHLKSEAELTFGIIESPMEKYQLTLDAIAEKQQTFVTCWSGEGLAIAMLYSVYTTPSTTHLNIEKVDSSGYFHIPGLATTVVRAILDYYQQICSHLRIQIYCASSEQYLFHLSNRCSEKRIHSDRLLIQWWLKVCDFLSEKYWVIPGENINSVKRMLPSSDWKWGLDVGMKSRASELPIFPDDMIKKGLEYSDTNATVADLIEILGCMETAAGMRGIIVAKSFNHVIKKSHSFLVQNYDELYFQWVQFCFDTKENTLSASRKWKSLIPKQNLHFLKISLDAEEENALADVSKLGKIDPKQLDVGLVKRKPEIRDLTNLVKKKKVK
jgi:hypothetical protein